MTKKTFYILRHGEIYSGSWWWWRMTHLVSFDRDDPPLSEGGMQKSEVLGQVLLKEKFVPEAIVVSPFIRCIQTATQIQKSLEPTSEVIINPMLGEYEFLWKHLCANYPYGLPASYVHKTENGNKKISCNYPETYEDMQKRCEFVAEEIMSRYDNAIFITHGSLVKFFAGYFSGNPENENLPIHFSDYIKVTIDENNVRTVEIINW